MQELVRDPSCFEESIMSATDEQLIAGTIRGDAEALRELLQKLRPRCKGTLWDRFRTLGRLQADILDEAESLLFEWALAPDARERFRPNESLGALAFRLVHEVVQRRVREERRQARLASAFSAELEESVVPPPEAAYCTEAIEEVIDSLSEEQREVITAEVRFQRREGPPVFEALGITVITARTRLCRARAALYRALVDKGLVEPQENPHVR
jgi:DNA-directed RNA polymerase specialized sigma24 family protein